MSMPIIAILIVLVALNIGVFFEPFILKWFEIVAEAGEKFYDWCEGKNERSEE